MPYLVFFCRWDPKKRMTPDEAAHHEWLQPSSTPTYIVSKTAREQSKENNESQNSLLHKYGRNQPITPNTILPEIKTPSNRIGQRFSKEKTKGKFFP